MFAIIETGGKQYKVKEGDAIRIDKINSSVGEKVLFYNVLLLSKDDKEIKVGQPYLKDAQVEVEVLEQGKGDKIKIIKYKSKVRYRKKTGFRSLYTKIKILKIIS